MVPAREVSLGDVAFLPVRDRMTEQDDVAALLEILDEERVHLVRDVALGGFLGGLDRDRGLGGGRLLGLLAASRRDRDGDEDREEERQGDSASWFHGQPFDDGSFR